MEAPAPAPVEVTSDGRTVWINTSICVARFGPNGYEVGDLAARFTRKGSSFDGQTTASDWTSFVAHVKKTLGVTVEETHRPTRLKNPE